MSLTSFNFILYIVAGLMLFYGMKSAQKYTLFFLNMAFYFLISPATLSYRLKLGGIILYIWGITYFGGIIIAKVKQKWKSTVTFACIAGLLAILFFTKYLFNIVTQLALLFDVSRDFNFLSFGTVIGASYFILSAIGYLVDICWESYPPEKSPLTVANFIFFFPQIISGPVTRFSVMQEQLNRVHVPQLKQFEKGLCRMIWGYFKKLVISDRLVILVGAAFGAYESMSGLEILFATLLYAFRLYTDFSGCMDIIMGVATMFDIALPENFHAPFLSKTVQEFWQRWHISLGTWFKDYVMYPLQKTGFMVRLGKNCRKRFGKKTGKKIPMYLSMAVLWFLMGLWHGGLAYLFLASAGIPFLLLLLGDLTKPLWDKLSGLLKIPVQSKGFTLFRILRTALALCACWFVVCAGSVERTGLLLRYSIKNFLHFSGQGMFQTAGLLWSDYLLLVLGLALLLTEEILTEKGRALHLTMQEKPLCVKAVCVNAELLLIFFFGLVGTSSFIYFNF